MELHEGDIVQMHDRSLTVLKLLGHGKGGYSWLATDGIEQYTLKALHHEPCDYYTFGDKFASEMQDYHRLSEAGVPIPRILDSDHERELILKEFVDGPTAANLVAQKALPEDAIAQIEALSEQLRQVGLNIDWYPTNFILDRGRFVYVDYECNSYMDEWSFERWGMQYWQN